MKMPTKIAAGQTEIERRIRVSTEPIAPAVPGAEKPATAPRKASDYVKRSRAKNPEAYRAYQRDFMRKWRAKK